MPPKRRSLKSKVKEEDEELVLRLSPEQEDFEAEAEVAAAVDQLLASPAKDVGSEAAPPQPLMAATLSVARNRLSTLLSKVHREDSDLDATRISTPILEASSLLTLDGPESPSAARNKGADLDTPSSPSKKKKKRELVDVGGPHHTYVMKLFDRSVDLAQFNEKTALYPVCRAWMANKPRQPPKLQLSDSEEELDLMDLTEDDLGKPVRKMPTPAIKTEAHSRVPQQLPQKPSLDFIPKVEQGEDTDFLEAHKQHWRQVKQDWVTAAFANEKRYDKSVKIIEDIYKRAQELYT